MKRGKQLIRNADGTKTLLEPYKVAIDANGNARRVYAGAHGYHLPEGARWADEDDELPEEPEAA